MILTFLYLLTICYGENTQEAHNARLGKRFFKQNKNQKSKFTDFLDF